MTRTRWRQARLFQYNAAIMRLYVLLILSAAIAGCGADVVDVEAPVERRRDPPEPARILFVATCTVNAGYLGVYGATLGLTPNLDAFAERGAVFEAHRTEAGASGISYASIFSGQQADGHGVFMQPRVLDRNLDLIGESLSDRGYEVWYWGGHAMASPKFRYGQGAMNRYGDLLRHPQGIRDAVAGDEPVALITTGTITHTPYNRDGLETFDKASAEFEALSPERVEELLELFYENQYALKYAHAEFVEERGLSQQDVLDLATVVETLYRLNIARLDTLFGLALDAIGEDALVVFTVDHGEILYDPDEVHQWSHGQTLSRNVMRVPLIIAGPGVKPGRHRFVSRSIDVAPTVAGLVGAPASDQWQGVDLSAVLRGEAEAPALDAYSHTGFTKNGEKGLYAIRRGGLVGWLRDGEFSVRKAGNEQVDIFDPADPEHIELRNALRQYRHHMRLAHDPDAAVEPEESEEVLRSLGYIE